MPTYHGNVQSSNSGVKLCFCKMLYYKMKKDLNTILKWQMLM